MNYRKNFFFCNSHKDTKKVSNVINVIMFNNSITRDIIENITWSLIVYRMLIKVSTINF